MKSKIYGKLFSFCVLGLALIFVFPAHAQLKAKITVTQGKLDSVCGTHNVKLVFTCQNYLWLVDFSQATPTIQMMSGVSSPYFPVISSDGNWVAYQTGIEAEGGPSASTLVGKSWIRPCAPTGTSVDVADTGYVPRFVQNASADTPEIVYSTSIACPNLLCYDGGQTLKKRIINNVAQPAEVVFGQGSYYGGLSWDNRYLNTGWEGGPNAFMLDLQDPSGIPNPVHTMRTLKIKKDSTALDTFDMVPVGTCNISRPASRVFTNTMMYFDFGSAAIKAAGCYQPLLGTWSLHQKIFISRYDGEDLKVFDMPSDLTLISTSAAKGIGEPIGKAWDNPEWSTHPYYAAASLEIDRVFKDTVSGVPGYMDLSNREAIYLLDLKDSSYVRLVQVTDTTKTSTTTIGYPYLWIDVPAGFQEDSTWLSQTIWQKAGINVTGVYTIGVKQNPVAPKSVHTAPTLWSNTKATRIVVYSALGEQIAVLTKAVNKDISPTKFLNQLRPGIYFIGVEAPGQNRQVVRWVVSHQ